MIIARPGLWLLSACVLGASPALSQVPDSPLFRRLGAVDGLPSDRITRIAQDRAGYLWIGTMDGLARFDGVGFRVWQRDPDDPGALPGNEVEALHIDAQDRVWVGTTHGGLSMMGPERRGFRNFHVEDPHRFPGDMVWAIASQPDGSLWFGGLNGGLHRYVPARDEVEHYHHDPAREASLSSDTVVALTDGGGGQLWIATGAGYDRWSGGQVQRQPPAPGTRAGLPVLSLLLHGDGRLWSGSVTGLQQRLPSGEVTRLVLGAFPSQRFNVMLPDRDGGFWMGSYDGVVHASADPSLPGAELHHWLRGEPVMDALQDHEGGLWFASDGAGMKRLPANWRDFSVFAQGEATLGGIGSGFVRGITEAHDGAIWLTGDGDAIDRIGRDGSVQRHLEGIHEIRGARALSIAATRDGALWIGGATGLLRYEPGSGQRRAWTAQNPADEIAPGPVHIVISGAGDDLWHSQISLGIQHRALDGRVLGNWRVADHPQLGVGLPSALRIGPDRALWLANERGLFRLPEGGTHFTPVPGAPASSVAAFVFDRDGSLWLQRSGVLEHYRFAASGLSLLQRVGREHGMPAIDVGGIQVAADGDVWMTSARGLLRYRRASREVRVYGIRDGLPAAEFHAQQPLLNRHGEIVAGTAAGLVWFDPARIERHRSAVALRLERVSVRRDGAELELDAGRPLQLRHDDRELQFATRLTSFANPGSHRYRFRLLGHDDGWIDAGARGERSYSRLAPGTYRFQAVAAATDDVWTARPLELELQVQPPWWQTPRAHAAFVLVLLLAGLMLLLQQRERQRRREQAALRRQHAEWLARASEAKSDFLATLGHEIRTPMTGVLGMTELLLRTPLDSRQHDYAAAIQRSGEVMLRLVNDALDLARIEAGRLELDDAPFDLPALVAQVARGLQPLAERKQLAFDCRIDAAAPRWVRGDAIRLQQILLNLGNNALKFTALGRVSLALLAPQAPWTVRVAVEDTGPGLSEAQRARLFHRFVQADGVATARRHGGSGLGLAICREFAAAMGGTIDVHSEVGRGSSFVLQLPLVEWAAPAPPDPDSRTITSLPARILLVEDDPTIAAVVSGLLQTQGHEVVPAAHGLAALAEAAQRRFDLAFVDLDLPGVDGLQLARMLRAQYPSLPLCALTARADADAEPQARSAGMQAFLRKPVAGEALARTVDVLREH